MATSMGTEMQANLDEEEEQREVIDLVGGDDEDADGEELDADAAETQDDACCICQDTVSAITQGYLSGCDHRFHFDCIVTWSKVTNLCPLCKQKFNEVTRRDTDGAVSHRERVADTKQVFRPDPRDHDITAQLRLIRDVHCSVCGRGDDEHVLLMCEALGCNNANHTYCIGLPQVPARSWYCGEHANTSAPSRASDLIARPASTVTTRRRTRRLASLMSNIIGGVTSASRGQARSSGSRRGVRSRGGRLAMPDGESMELQNTRPIRGLALSYALRMSRELQAIQQRADTMFARGDLGPSALYAPPRSSILGTRSTSRSMVESMWDDFAQSRRMIQDATEADASHAIDSTATRGNRISSTFTTEYREMAQRMTQAASNDNYASTVSLTIPKTGRLRLVSAMKAFFNRLNDRERVAALENGCLSLFLSWVRPTETTSGSASSIDLHPHVLEAVLTSLEGLPVRKQDLEEVPRFRPTLDEIANQADVDLALRERCVLLSEKWRAINPPVEVASSLRSVSTVPQLIPSTLDNPTTPSLPAIQTFAARAPATVHSKSVHSSKKRSTPSSDAKWQPVAVDYVKRKLYPVYKDAKFHMSKDQFKAIVKQVVERFRGDATRMQSDILASNSQELSSIAKKRLMQLLDQVYREARGKGTTTAGVGPATHDFSSYSAVPSSSVKRPRIT